MTATKDEKPALYDVKIKASIFHAMTYAQTIVKIRELTDAGVVLFDVSSVP